MDCRPHRRKFNPRKYDGTSISIEHADGLVAELGDVDCAIRTTGMQNPVFSRTLAFPPSDPNDGDRYIVAASGASGDWEDLENYIVEYDEEIWDWAILAPREGMLVYVGDEDEYLSFDGVQWESLQEAHSHVTLPTPDEKAALQGTHGSPSVANKYVTDSDPRLVGAAGGGPQMVQLYIINPTEGLDTDIDPSIEEVLVTDADDHTRWTVMLVSSYNLAAGTQALSIGVVLRWKSKASVGTGWTKWMISTGVELVGSEPSGAAVDILKNPIDVGDTERFGSVAGLIKDSALPAGDFSLLLVGKPNLAGELMTAKVLTESTLDLSY